MRLLWPTYTAFGFDEAQVSRLALLFAQDGIFPALGMQSSTGIPNFPAVTWLYAIPFRLSTNPVYANLFTGLINVAAIAGVWRLATVWGRKPALVSALLFASAPWLVFYSRNIWSQNWLVPLSVLWAVAAVLGIGRQRFWWLVLHVMLAGFVLQVHYAGIALVLGSAWLVLRFKLWQRWPEVLIGSALAILCMLPTFRHIFVDNPETLTQLNSVLDQPSQLSPLAWQQTFDLGRASGWDTLWLGTDWQWPALQQSLLTLGSLGLALGIGSSLALAVWKFAQSFSAPPTEDTVLISLLPIWTVASGLFFMRSSTPVFIHYQLASVPALFLACGLGVRFLPSRVQTAALLLTVGIAATQALSVGQTLHTYGTQHSQNGMGTPLYYPQAAADALPGDVVVHANSNNLAWDGDAASFSVLLWDQPHRVVDGNTTLLIPATNGQLLFITEQLPALGAHSQLFPTVTQAAYPRRVGDSAFQAVTAPDSTALDFTTITPTPLANGATLIGWRLEQTAAGQRLYTVWQIAEAQPTTAFQQFNHVYTPGATTPDHGVDGPTSSTAWRTGDTLITWADFPTGFSVDRFEVGMYTLDTLTRSPRQDGLGDVIVLTE